MTTTTGSNNFLQFNPNRLNATENDTTYLADTTRVDGLSSGIASPSLHNKLFYQLSTMVAAIGQVIANRGQTSSDVSLSALITAIDAVFPIVDTSDLADTSLSNLTNAGLSVLDKDIISLTPTTTTTISTTSTSTSTTTTTTTTSTATLTMDATHTLAIAQACTIVLPIETTTKPRICRLKLTMSSVVTLTFPSTVKWVYNINPSLTSTTATYVVTFITEDGGASWEGSCSTFGA